MEDIIVKELCNFCINKCDNCMKCNIIKKNELTTYNCDNYIKNESKIKGYDEKWIDNILTSLEINKFGRYNK